MHSKANPAFNLVFVGSGISCSAVLLQLLDELERKPDVATHHLKIAVIEKENEFWRGVPYGNRSLITALIITNFGEFVPPSEKQAFICWLEEREEQWSTLLLQNGGATAANWFAVNQSAINSRRWDDIYIPRWLFGEYLEEKITKKFLRLREEGKISVELIRGEVTDMDKEGEVYSIELHKAEDDEAHTIFADKVVLSIGSPPFKEINILAGTDSCINIRDPYCPSMNENISAIISVLESIPEFEKRNLFILGSNASCLELLYHFQSDERIKESLNKIIVLSGSGDLPYRITDGNIPGYTFENLEKLRSGEELTSTELMEAIRSDLKTAISKGVNVGDMYYQLSDLVVELLDKSGEKEKEHFHCFFGADFSKLIRRAGSEYRDAAKELESEGKLEILKGSFLKAEQIPQGKNEVRIIYEDFVNNQVSTLPLSFPALINCGGFEKLNGHSSSTLISNLLSKKLCEVNCTNRGIRVNEKFEARKGLYIIGPLLGGIFNSKTRLWHLENAKNIFQVSENLSCELASSFAGHPVFENNRNGSAI